MGEVTYSQVRANLNARLSAGEFQLVELTATRRPGSSRLRKPSKRSSEILRTVGEGRNQAQPALSRSQAIAVADQHSHLNRAQKSVVEDVLSSRDRIQGIQGYAGTGKTTTLSVIRAAAESQGYTVEGLAPTSRAARQLAKRRRNRNPAGFPDPWNQSRDHGKEAFLFRGRVEPGKHEPNPRIP